MNCISKHVCPIEQTPSPPLPAKKIFSLKSKDFALKYNFVVSNNLAGLAVQRKLVYAPHLFMLHSRPEEQNLSVPVKPLTLDSLCMVFDSRSHWLLN